MHLFSRIEIFLHNNCEKFIFLIKNLFQIVLGPTLLLFLAHNLFIIYPAVGLLFEAATLLVSSILHYDLHNTLHHSTTLSATRD